MSKRLDYAVVLAPPRLTVQHQHSWWALPLGLHPERTPGSEQQRGRTEMAEIVSMYAARSHGRKTFT